MHKTGPDKSPHTVLALEMRRKGFTSSVIKEVTGKAAVRAYGEARETDKTLSWKIISDPSGLFEPGRYLGLSDVTQTLKDSNFPEGMVLKRLGKCYEVVNGPMKQTLVYIDRDDGMW